MISTAVGDVSIMRVDADDRCVSRKANLHQVSCEVTVKPSLVLDLPSLERTVGSFLVERSKKHSLEIGKLASSAWGEVPALREGVKQIRLADFPESIISISFWDLQDVDINVYAFYANEDQAETDDAGDEEGTHQVLQLPSSHLDGYWDSLELEVGVKSSLLSYAHSALLFSDLGVDESVISWNRVVLLYGPPGTGKCCLIKRW